MWSAATVLVCALNVLGRSAGTLPPIEFVDHTPLFVSAKAEAYVLTGEKTIYILTSTPFFRSLTQSSVRCGDVDLLKKLASIVVHEEWHVRNGPDERGAYEAQLRSLIMMGYRPGASVFETVRRSMTTVLAQRKDAPPSLAWIEPPRLEIISP